MAVSTQVFPLSFPMTIRKMTQILESLLESSDETSIIGPRLGYNMEKQQKWPPIMHGATINGREEESSSSSKKYTIQFAQKVSHPIDKLCWLHANQPRIDALTSLRTSGSANSQKPISFKSREYIPGSRS